MDLIGSQMMAEFPAILCHLIGSQMMAKVGSSIHKPNDQTVVFPLAHEYLLHDMPARKVPGVGMYGSSLYSKTLGGGLSEVLWIW